MERHSLRNISGLARYEGMTPEERLRRQLIAFVQFTAKALGEKDLGALTLEACLRARGGLGVSHAKVLEYRADEDRLVLSWGVGWKPGVIGNYRTQPDIRTPIGYAFAVFDPVVVSNYSSQKRWVYPQILKDHGCVSSINVPVRTEQGTFGVLEVDDTAPREFTSDDIYFLKGLANVLGECIELNKASEAAEQALARQQLLMREMNHRIKNNLSLVAAMLMLQAKQSQNAEVSEELKNASSRINNLSLVHDRLQLIASFSPEIDAAAHFNDLCRLLRSLLPPGVTLTAHCSGNIWARSVEALTLIANELVTNAAKYAFSDRTNGEIVLGYRQQGVGWHLWVSDNGRGMDAEPPAKSSFGRYLTSILASRLQAEIAYTSNNGTRVDVYNDLRPDES